MMDYSEDKSGLVFEGMKCLAFVSGGFLLRSIETEIDLFDKGLDLAGICCIAYPLKYLLREPLIYNNLVKFSYGIGKYSGA